MIACMTTPIFYIKAGALSFADKLIFDELELYLYPQDKICFVGKNGAGKSSLLKIITGEYELDSGQIYQSPHLTIAYLKQESEINSSKKIRDYLLDSIDNEDYKFMADIMIDKLSLDPERVVSSLSGGFKRRVALAKTLATPSDVLLLDEPTNHLDIKSIEWLEEFMRNFDGVSIIISHDRTFLANITNRIWWLDRGFLRKSSNGFRDFEKWQESIIEFEENQLKKLDKKLAVENIWLSQGVTARRKRNQKRLASLKILRSQMQNFKSTVTAAKEKLSIELDTNSIKSKFVISAEGVEFFYDEKPIIQDFNIRIIKGEKIGVIGPNGCGKSTLIKLLTKNLTPTRGNMKHGVTIDITYLDQQRLELCQDQTIAKFLCPTGGDRIFLKDKEMHVAGYLKKFLFDPKMRDAKISILSGGQKNRLLLAKALISPGNFMVLDEPTNDLDIETLDLLIEILSDYEGTLIIVSHDRDFLDKLVTKTLIFTENGIQQISGGFTEYQNLLRDSFASSTAKNSGTNKIRDTKNKDSVHQAKQNHAPKITFKDLHLKQELPKQIESLEKEIMKFERELGDTTLYNQNPVKFHQITNILKQKQSELDVKLNIWIEMEEKYQ